MTVFPALGLSSVIYFCYLFCFFIGFISLFLLSSSWGLTNFISTWTHRKCLIQGAKWSPWYHGDPKTNNKPLTCSPQAHTHISQLETSQMPLASPSAPGVFRVWRWSPQKTRKQRSLINGGPIATVSQQFSFQCTYFGTGTFYTVSTGAWLCGPSIPKGSTLCTTWRGWRESTTSE